VGGLSGDFEGCKSRRALGQTRPLPPPHPLSHTHTNTGAPSHTPCQQDGRPRTSPRARPTPDLPRRPLRHTLVLFPCLTSLKSTYHPTCIHATHITLIHATHPTLMLLLFMSPNSHILVTHRVHMSPNSHVLSPNSTTYHSTQRTLNDVSLHSTNTQRRITLLNDHSTTNRRAAFGALRARVRAQYPRRACRRCSAGSCRHLIAAPHTF